MDNLYTHLKTIVVVLVILLGYLFIESLNKEVVVHQNRLLIGEKLKYDIIIFEDDTIIMKRGKVVDVR